MKANFEMSESRKKDLEGYLADLSEDLFLRERDTTRQAIGVILSGVCLTAISLLMKENPDLKTGLQVLLGTLGAVLALKFIINWRGIDKVEAGIMNIQGRIDGTIEDTPDVTTQLRGLRRKHYKNKASVSKNTN